MDGDVREKYLREMGEAAARLGEAIAGLSDEQASLPAIDGWSVKDHLTHVTFWHEMRFFEVSRIARGGRAGFPVTDEEGVRAVNEQFAANRRRLPLEQVIADLDFARAMVRRAVEDCPAERLAPSLFEEIAPTGAGHDSEHAEVIAAWRRKEGI